MLSINIYSSARFGSTEKKGAAIYSNWIQVI